MKPLYSVLILGFALFFSPDGIGQTSDSAYTAQAVTKFSQGQYSDAISLCDIVIRRNSRYAWAYNIRGISYAGSGASEKTRNNGIVNTKATQYYESAINDYTKAIEIDPNYQVAYSNRALACYVIRRYDNAIRDWSKVLSIDPKNIEAWRERGNTYFINSDYTNAVLDYDQAIHYEPAYIWNYYNRGKANYYRKRYKEAIPDFTMTIGKDPKYVDAYNFRGLCYYYLQEYDNSEADFNMAIQLDPRYQYPYFNRAGVYYAKKDYSKAILDYSSAIKADPSYVDAYNSRGLAYEAMKQYDKAEADYLEAIRLKPNFKWAYYNLGLVYYNQDKHEKAKNWFTKAIELDPKYGAAYIERGWSNFNLKDYAKAVDDCSMAIGLDPNSANAFNNRGIIYTITGKYNEAIEDFKKVLSLNPDYSWAYVNILIPCVQNGDYNLAKNYYGQYQQKNMNGYFEHDRWKFLKTYLLASMNELANGQYQKAQQLYQDANKQYTEYINTHTDVLEGTKIYIAFVFSKLGITYEKLNSFAEARNYYDKALMINPYVPESQQALTRLENRTKTYTSSDKTPPSFRLLPPRDTIVFEGGNRTTIIGKASDAGGIAWVKIDGKNVDNVEEDGTFYVELTANTGKKFIDFEVQDKAGNNTRKSIATMMTRGGRVSQTEDALKITGAKFYGLFISAEKYTDPTLATLNHPKKDVEELKKVLVNNYTFNNGDITILSDKSREDILEAISTTVEKMGPNDNLIIFFAGHGAYRTGLTPTDLEGYLLPVSAKKGRYSTYISASDITTAIKNCKAHHVLLLTDACYSGSLVRRNTSENNAVELQYKYKSRQLMASGNLEPVPDDSKFIYYLLTRLKENTDRVLTADDLFQRLKTATINNTSGKTLPICSAILDVGDEGGQFVFIKK